MGGGGGGGGVLHLHILLFCKIVYTDVRDSSVLKALLYDSQSQRKSLFQLSCRFYQYYRERRKRISEHIFRTPRFMYIRNF